MMRLALAAVLLLLGSSAAFAQATCVTPYGSCPVATSVEAAQGQCVCATPNGIVAGTVSTGDASGVPHFCCTPSGRFGPDPNATAAVGQPCQANLPNGTVMAGQACF